MISFYPGPSKVYETVPAYVKEAYEQGILSINHRSKEFAKVLEYTIKVIKEKLQIPHDYSIFFVSSATECWEILAQSLIRQKSFHIYNGAFGEKWHYYTKRLNIEAVPYAFEPDQELQAEVLPIPEGAELICLTHNETSNGTEISNEIIRRIRSLYPGKLIAVDATSSLAGVYLDISQADLWYASVQKCFGLPAGMAVLICSPAAIEKAFQIGEKNHYNSLTFMYENFSKLQTTHTPNVLNIFLLQKVMQAADGICEVDKKIKENASNWYNFFSGLSDYSLLIGNSRVRSNTVISIKAQPELISRIKSEALKEGFILGSGYGNLRESTFRIANFPAIHSEEINQLKDFFNRKIS